MPVVGEFAEPDDSRESASATGVGTTHRAIRTTGRIAGQDQDFYRLRGAGPTSIATRTPGSDLDTVLTVFDAAGEEIASNDTVGLSTDARLEAELTVGADYFVRVTGTENTEGTYELTLSAGEGKGDRDFFAVDLKAGDVIGVSVAGAARKVVVHDTVGREVMGSQQDFSGACPKENPLPGGGNAVADHLAPRDGRYYVGVEDGAGRYELTVRAFRPGSEKAPQTVFADFNGALVDTGVWGLPGGEAAVAAVEVPHELGSVRTGRRRDRVRCGRHDPRERGVAREVRREAAQQPRPRGSVGAEGRQPVGDRRDDRRVRPADRGHRAVHRPRATSGTRRPRWCTSTC
ncbi:hypothetical protein C8D88_103378 [Lentzea atacamensis]|uniref:Peptidase C-terminal archaeal/bacterial domain-containing protein n=1 Tax=Lentzea atacamensis TaxID=531938 RepID=A0A316ICW5_9PSEU|nr:hypothetical protein [Lentzea atacamensis]PWK88182.1 hypothetical protein C8D88_103378 [Lentzea atacamensis]